MVIQKEMIFKGIKPFFKLLSFYNWNSLFWSFINEKGVQENASLIFFFLIK